MADINCRNFGISVNQNPTEGNPPEITAEDVAKVMRYLHTNAPTARKLFEEIERLKGKVLVSVDNDYVSPIAGGTIPGDLDDTTTTQNPGMATQATILFRPTEQALNSMVAMDMTH